MSVISTPWYKILPDVGSSIQLRHLKNVLLPEPEGPITTTLSPWLIVISIPFKTSFSPNYLCKSMTSITLFQTPFGDFYHSGNNKNEHNIDCRHYKIRYHKFVVVCTYILKRNIKVSSTYEAYN